MRLTDYASTSRILIPHKLDSPYPYWYIEGIDSYSLMQYEIESQSKEAIVFFSLDGEQDSTLLEEEGKI